MAPTRADAVQSLLDLFENPRYLEIGVNRGETFHTIKCNSKVAVDPQFLFDVAEAETANPGAEYHEVTSDAYFGALDIAEKFQVIYIDGLHTSEQTLRDLMNATERLADDGVILIDDVKPTTYLASLPNRQNFFKVRHFLRSNDQSWMGDVYRCVYFIETFMQQWSYRTISDNHGQTILWRQPRSSVPERTIVDVGSKTFEDFALEQDMLKLARLGEIIETIKLHRSQEKPGTLIVPFSRPYVGGPDPEAIPEHARKFEGGKPVDVFPPEARDARKDAAFLPGRWLYGGPMKSQFGHLIIDTSTRLYAFDRAKHKGVVFAGMEQDSKPPGIWQDILNRYGITPDDTVVIRKPTVVEALDCPVPGMIVGFAPQAWYLDYLEKSRPAYSGPTPKKVFFGRCHILQLGTLMGESYFRDLLLAEGFEYVTPESYQTDFPRQLAIIANAEQIVFTEGSSIHSADMLGRIKAPIYMIPRRAQWKVDIRAQLERQDKVCLPR